MDWPYSVLTLNLGYQCLEIVEGALPGGLVLCDPHSLTWGFLCLDFEYFL